MPRKTDQNISTIRTMASDWLCHVVVAAAIILGLWVASSSPSRAGDWDSFSTLLDPGTDCVSWDCRPPRRGIIETIPPGGKEARYDIVGNPYPPSCYGSLEDIPAHIHFVDMDKMFGPLKNGGVRLGLWREPTDGTLVSNIYVTNKIKNPLVIRQIIHHEKCHAVWWMKYGHPDWHAPSE